MSFSEFGLDQFLANETLNKNMTIWGPMLPGAGFAETANEALNKNLTIWPGPVLLRPLISRVIRIRPFVGPGCPGPANKALIKNPTI